MILAATVEGGLALAKMPRMPWMPRMPSIPRAPSTGPTGRHHLVHLLLLGAVALALALLLNVLLAVADSGTRSELGAARRENGDLRVRQEALRAELFEAARRLEALEPGRQTPGEYHLLF